MRDSRTDVGSNVLLSELLEMRLIVEALAAIPDSRSPPEVVDCHSVDAGFCESLSKLLVEGMQATHVGQHHHARARRLRGARKVRAKLRSVGRCQDEIAVVRRGAANRRQGWTRVIAVAHARILA